VPFWPWYMLACLALAIWGRGRQGVFAPIAILCGLIAMRGVIWGFDPLLHEVASYTVWLCIAVALMYKGAWLPGAFCLLSGVTYPTLLVLGVRIEYLGLTPIIADALLIAAIFTGWAGMVGNRNSGADRARMVSDDKNLAVGMAAHKTRIFITDRRGMEIGGR